MFCKGDRVLYLSDEAFFHEFLRLALRWGVGPGKDVDVRIEKLPVLYLLC